MCLGRNEKNDIFRYFLIRWRLRAKQPVETGLHAYVGLRGDRESRNGSSRSPRPTSRRVAGTLWEVIEHDCERRVIFYVSEVVTGLVMVMSFGADKE
jgi:hypothetical protein